MAIVAAETREIASQALDLIEVEIEPLPVVSSAVQAHQPETRAHPSHWQSAQAHQGAQGRYRAGLRRSRCRSGTHLPHPHPRSRLYGAGMQHRARSLRRAGWKSTSARRSLIQDREQVARALGMPQEQVHIIGQLIGGGFGGKEDIVGPDPRRHAGLRHQAAGQAALRPPGIACWSIPSATPPRSASRSARCAMAALTASETELYGDTGAYASPGRKSDDARHHPFFRPVRNSPRAGRLLRHVYQQSTGRRLPRLWRVPIGLCGRKHDGYAGQRAGHGPGGAAPPERPARGQHHQHRPAAQRQRGPGGMHRQGGRGDAPPGRRPCHFR